jgi:hypothetical protein
MTNKRMIFNIHPSIHEKVKKYALKKNITMTRYVLQAILEKMSWDDKVFVDKK